MRQREQTVRRRAYKRDVRKKRERLEKRREKRREKSGFGKSRETYVKLAPGAPK